LTGRAPSVRDVAFASPTHFASALQQPVADVEDLAAETDLEARLIGAISPST
jgi:hypothetical protein